MLSEEEIQRQLVLFAAWPNMSPERLALIEAQLRKL